MSDRTKIDYSLVHEFADPQARLAALRANFSHLDGVDLIHALYENFGANMGAITSFGANAPLLLGQVARIDPDMAIYTADAGEHSNPMTSYNRTRLEQQLGLGNIKTQPMGEQNIDQLGEGECCGDFKNAALNEGLDVDNIDVVVAGLNISRNRGRSDVQKFELGQDGKRIVVNPNADYDDARIDAELRALGLGEFAGDRQRYPTCGHCAAAVCGMWGSSIAIGPR